MNKKTELRKKKLRQIANRMFRAAAHVFFLFPIRKDRIVFNSFRGKQFSCNPKYISEYLRKNYPGQFQLVWPLMEPEKFPELPGLGYKVVKKPSLAYFFYTLTAHVFVVNGDYTGYLPPRKGQYDIRTWHGGGAYKRVGLSVQNGDVKDETSVRLNQRGADLYLSSSRKFTELTLHEGFRYEGEIFEYGMPRNDMLLKGPDPEISARVRRALGVPDGKKIVLYAPTYRQFELPKDSALDYENLKNALSDRFGGEWVCLFRGHHVHSEVSGKIRTDGVINATAYPDMQELLMVADVLITDYSSSIWDMSLTYKPTFLYATDLDSYQSERDFYYDIHTWPFPLAENNAELRERILSFDEEKYRADVDEHHRKLGSCETGHATETVCRRIYEICKGVKA